MTHGRNRPGGVLAQELLFAGPEPLTGGGVDGLRADAGHDSDATRNAAGQSKPDIEIEIASGARLTELHAAWQDLCTRADAANVFMNPVLAGLAAQAYPERRSTALLAWQNDGAMPPRLLGIWAFSIGHAAHSLLPTPMLCAPPVPNAYLATPVIDRHCIDAVLIAMIDCIARHKDLPAIVALEAMGADTATMQALVRVLRTRGAAPYVFSRARRPHLSSRLDGKTYLEQALSASSRKKLRQHRRRLAEKGDLKSAIVSEPMAVRAGFEDFLQLEAAGWKGREGAAMLRNSVDAEFERALIGALADNGDAAIHILTLDGRPVSMQMVLRAGACAFTWKTAYDEALRDFSPGTLLLEDYTAALLADATVTDVDSCSFDDSGFMGVWTERAEIADLWFDARGGSLSFSILSRVQAVYLALRNRAKAIYHELQQRKAAVKKT